MLRRCLQRGQSSNRQSSDSPQKQCGAVYLHVIHDNEAAIRFYCKNGFRCYRSLGSFYVIDKQSHTAYLYILYVNGCEGSALKRLLHQALAATDTLVQSTLQWVSSTIAGLLVLVQVSGSTGSHSAAPPALPTVEQADAATATNAGACAGAGAEGEGAAADAGVSEDDHMV